MEKLLLLGSDKASFDILEYARSNGIYTIVTDDRTPEISFAKKWADEFWMINTSETELLKEKCLQENINGVICGLSEYNIEMMMKLTKSLNLPCYCKPESWIYSKDKALFKEECKKAGVQVPLDYYIQGENIEWICKDVKYPVVVKPVDQNGNRGVSYCYKEEDLLEAIKEVRNVSRSEKLIVEKLIRGEEWYATYAMANGEARLVALNAMYAQPGEPKNCYTVTTTVSNHVKRFVNTINADIKTVLKNMGIDEGIVWVQVMLDEDDTFYAIEMGQRLDGDMMYNPYKGICGFDFVKWLVDYNLGHRSEVSQLPPPQVRAYEKCACGFMLWANKDGVIKEIIGLDKIAKIPGVSVRSISKIGGKIEKYHPLGNIRFVSPDCKQMCKFINYINETVKIINENGEDVIIKYTDFDYLEEVYNQGLNE